MSAFIIVPTSNRAGLTSVSLGVLRAFEQSNIKPLFFKPIEQSYVTQLEQQIDPAVHFAQELFHMPTVAPLALNEVEMLISQGKDDDMVELVVQRMSELRLQQAHDVVVIEGLAPDSDRPFLADKNLALARALQADVLTNKVQSDDLYATYKDAVDAYSAYEAILDFEKQQTPTAETAAAKSTAKAEAAATEESDPGLLDGLLTGLFGGRRKNNANLSNKIGAQMGHNISNKLTKTITDSITRTILGVIKGK